MGGAFVATRGRLANYNLSREIFGAHSKLSPAKDCKIYFVRSKVANFVAIDCLICNLWGKYYVVALNKSVPMKLFLHRLSLSEKLFQSDIFDYAPSSEGQEMRSAKSRTDWLFEVFGSEQAFVYNAPGQASAEFRYICCQIEDSVIAGVVAKRKTAVGHFDRNDPLAEEAREEWATVNVFLNLGDDEQVIAIENNLALTSSPMKTLSDLIRAINEKNADVDGYKFDVFPVLNDATFWEAIERYPGKVRTLEIDLVVPNPEPSASITAEELEQLRKTMNLQRKTEVYQSDDGLELNNDMIRERAEYVRRGRGALKAKDGKTLIFSSEKSTKAVEVDEETRITKDKKPERFLSNLKDILKR